MTAESIGLAGGEVSRPKPTVDSLVQSAIEWQALAELHFAEAQAAAEAGNLELAIEQNRFAENKLATARVRLIEAHELRAMERGS